MYRYDRSDCTMQIFFGWGGVGLEDATKADTPGLEPEF